MPTATSTARSSRTTRRPTRAVTRRWRRAEPVQARSRETIERFAVAVEELLKDRPFEEIGVQDIVRRAGRPIGSFYARFGSKEALLPYLYQRYHEGLDGLFESRLARTDWESLDAATAFRGAVDFLIRAYTERRWLIRAIALFARAHPESLPEDLAQRRRQVFDRLVTVLMHQRAHIAHTDPEAAVRFAIFLVCSVAREKLLFDAPHSRVTPLTRTQLHDELFRVFHSYLTAKDPR